MQQFHFIGSKEWFISKLSPGPSAKQSVFQNKVEPTRLNIKYELPHSQVHPSFSRKVLAFGGRRTGQALPWGRHLSISILLQRLITLLCTSHTGQCAPSLKWYKIHTVQPVPPVAPAGGEGTVPGWAGTEQREHPPRGAGAQGKGLWAGGEAGGCPCVRERGAPIMCIMGSTAQGATGLEVLSASHAHTQAASSSPAPAPVLEQGRHHNHPGTLMDGKRKRSAGMTRFKNRDGGRSNKRSPFG